MPDIESLLAPLDEAHPSGPNLEYDPDFLALDILAAPRGERGVGDATCEAQEPEWRDVARQALHLAGKTRDLRLGMHLCTAWLKTDGPGGWLDGLALLRGMLERHWDSLHPRIDDGDPAERINALAALCADDGMLGYLRRVPLIRVERLGSVNLRELRITSGALKRGDDDASGGTLDEHVATVLAQAGHDALRALDDLVATALRHLDAIADVFSMRTPGQGPDVDPLRRELRECRGALNAYLPDTGDSLTENDDPTVQDASPRPCANGGIDGPDDVRRQLDAICQWYERHEPSSPVAPLLRRARGLVGLDFHALLAELAPGGLSEFAHLTGTTGDR
ncbi:type VI secretion system protein TssA [Luteibacter aegosomatis]|uniref:type VI secretion system protein TssA n=1 Tax=Luteibacter aegosomatis TaxID=2911537 RepID=UPI001FF99A93|nr:type VI secretion system protein TssA [Luteibacter aegosomatis]UPG84766.1 type VI secretion system protein TssA [Luteibacter aegosomatis]